jgi:hypothetical protein
MKTAICVTVGIILGFISSGIQSLFISRRDRYKNSSFTITLWKISWWVGGFIVGVGLTYKYFFKH